MKKEIRDKWVKALRSGKYQQGRAALEDHVISKDGKVTSTYCCLGVLRLVCDKNDLESACDSGMFLNERQLKQCGLKYETQEKLADMNDDGETFKEIASYIMKNL